METKHSESNHIRALDGLRGLTALIIAWFHIWQQSWLSPFVKLTLPFGLGRRTLWLEPLPRVGYVFVDLLLLLSAFLLFLPYARAELSVAREPDGALKFYKKRISRIVPSYLLCVIPLFLYAVFSGSYGSFSEAVRDFFATLTFTQTFSVYTYIGTKINGVLWTAAIEMEFYLIFPLLAKAFRKKPVLTWIGMTVVATAYLRFFALTDGNRARIWLNQLPGFLAVFANGMAASYLFVFLTERVKRKKRVGWLMTAASVAGTVFACVMIWKTVERTAMNTSVPTQVYQGNIRFMMSVAFALLTFCFSAGGKLFAVLFGNPVMRFLGAVSYNFYIWHQWLAVRLKEWRIPYWEGTELPNVTGNRVWQHQYTAAVFLGALALAAVITFCYERPVQKKMVNAVWFSKEETE